MRLTTLLTALPLLIPSTPNTRYSATKQGMEERRLAFQRSYQNADSVGQQIILDSAKAYLFDRITQDLLP
ncbi:MAG: hypothetical protein ACK46C_13660, partial [Flavobacteriales bacterium]